MNNAVYAIPGLMPPYAVNWRLQLFGPEDGSLYMLLHCGRNTDDVHYAIDFHQWRRGVLKDPTYKDLRKFEKKLPQFLVKSTVLPKRIIIPSIVRAGCVVPITDRCDIPEKDRRYWYIELPPNTLPVGDTVIEVSINGYVHEYIVQRQPFSMHKHRFPARKYKKYVNQPGETYDYAFGHLTGGTFTIDITHAKTESGEYVKDLNARFETTVRIGTDERIVGTSQNGNILTVTIPSGMAIGHGVWTTQYRNFGWNDLACGDLIILEEDPEPEDPEEDEEEKDPDLGDEEPKEETETEE